MSDEESNETLSIQTETRIIPVLAKLNRPKTYERIIVLPEPAEKDSHIVRPVTEHGVESNVKRRNQKTKYSVDIPETPSKQKRAPKNFDDGKGNYRKSVSYSKRTDNNRLPHDVNRIQPLHIDTGVFKKKSPNHAGNARPTKEQKDRLKLENLPQNPKEVPETSWFDNVGGYNYGILHSDGLTATPEYTATQPTTRAEARSMESKESAIEMLPPKATFKSSFRDPKQLNEPLLKHDNKLGAFLYKTEVHYPSYRNHLYPPVVTYGTHQTDLPATKELPTIHVHKQPNPLPKKHEAATKKPVETKQSQTDDGDDYDEEEDSSEDYEDGASNDKYEGEPPGDQEDEGEDENESSDDGESDDGESDESNNRPKYRFSFDEGGKSGSYELDEFDKAWAKFGYGPPKRDNSGSAEESSYESSETRVKPVRVKFYHEKKEEVTTGHKSKTSTTTEEPPPSPPPPRWPIKKMVKTVSGTINNNPRTKKQIPRKPIAVQPQADDEAQQPGPDDLKYFQ